MMYTMYMYKLNEFRQNTRQAFNDAREGHEVVIERYGELYQLVALVDLPLGGSSFESTPTEVKPLTPKFTPVANSNLKLCKNGHPIPAGRDRCMGKGCKYS